MGNGWVGPYNPVYVQTENRRFHFTVEAVTSDGPRSPVDVVRAAFRILDYKLSQFMESWSTKEKSFFFDFLLLSSLVG